MKYCTRCGTQLVDEAVICTGCGCAVTPTQSLVEVETKATPPRDSGLVVTAKIMMILGTIFNAFTFFLIPLAWCIPMTVVYFKKIKENQPIGTGFKVCSLLFVSLLGGILMLCDSEH